MSICRTTIIIKELQWMKEESIHRKVLHRLFEEELPKDLLTVLGHLVLLWFTVNTHILSVLYSHTAEIISLTLQYLQWFSKDRITG